MNLTQKQHEIIAFAARDIPPARIPDFTKYVFDVLRGKREVWNTDVTHACCAALVKFNANKMNGQNANTRGN
jgi:hypothetical protein